MKSTGWISWSKLRRFALSAILVLIIAAAAPGARSYAQAPSTTPPQAITCGLTETDKAANAKLSVSAFDYVATTPATARALGERGCFAAAAEAGEDYLIRGNIDSERGHSNVLFHIAQNLALSGDERAAARLVAAARRPSQMADASFDWNTYVRGTWAFLRRDRALLQSAFDTLKGQPGDGNQTNARVLGGLLHCFEQPYASAYSFRCQTGSEDSAPLPR